MGRNIVELFFDVVAIAVSLLFLSSFSAGGPVYWAPATYFVNDVLNVVAAAHPQALVVSQIRCLLSLVLIAPGRIRNRRW